MNYFQEEHIGRKASTGIVEKRVLITRFYTRKPYKKYPCGLCRKSMPVNRMGNIPRAGLGDMLQLPSGEFMW
jgi:hypothetical protein